MINYCRYNILIVPIPTIYIYLQYIFYITLDTALFQLKERFKSFKTVICDEL